MEAHGGHGGQVHWPLLGLGDAALVHGTGLVELELWDLEQVGLVGQLEGVGRAGSGDEEDWVDCEGFAIQGAVVCMAS